MQKKQVSIYNTIAQHIYNSSSLIITAGAGMGVDSGLPDFRGEKGFWTNYKPFRNRFQFWQCANPQFLIQHPKLFWGFYGHRLELYRKTNPHQGFQILREFSQLPNMKRHFVLTSNVDGHFQKSGFEQKNVYEFHGSINHFQCDSCCEIYPADGYNVKYDSESFEAEEPLPECKLCKSKEVRPNILMFSDWNFLEERIEKQKESFDEFYFDVKKHSQEKITIIEMGAGVSVQTTRMYSEQIFNYGRFKDIMFVRINPRDFQPPSKKWGDSQHSVIDGKQFIALKEGSFSALSQIQQELQQIQKQD